MTWQVSMCASLHECVSPQLRLGRLQMKFPRLLLFATTLLVLRSICVAQRDPKPQKSTAPGLHAFGTHDIVIFGEIHGNKQEYEWLRSLVATPEFADRVDDIVMEFGNSLFQKSV